jgi:hypothetical protein
MVNDETNSSVVSSNHIFSERKQISKEFYSLGVDTSASSKLGSLQAANEADAFSLNNETKKKRKQSFGSKKKFKEEIEVNKGIKNIEEDKKCLSNMISPKNEFPVANLRKHESAQQNANQNQKQKKQVAKEN